MWPKIICYILPDFFVSAYLFASAWSQSMKLYTAQTVDKYGFYYVFYLLPSEVMLWTRSFLNMLTGVKTNANNWKLLFSVLEIV